MQRHLVVLLRKCHFDASYCNCANLTAGDCLAAQATHWCSQCKPRVQTFPAVGFPFMAWMSPSALTHTSQRVHFHIKINTGTKWHPKS